MYCSIRFVCHFISLVFDMSHFIVKSVFIGLLYIEGTRGSSSAFTEIENAVRDIHIGDATMYNIQGQNDRVRGVVRHFQQPADNRE